MANGAWIGDDPAMRKTFPGPKGHGSPSYADRYSVGRQNRATRPAGEEKPRVKFLGTTEPLNFKFRRTGLKRDTGMAGVFYCILALPPLFLVGGLIVTSIFGH